MTEVENKDFDLSVKKKKKKKTLMEGETEEVAEQENGPTTEQPATEQADGMEDFGKKKKKKKKVTIDEEGGAAPDAAAEDGSFDFGAKKKKPGKPADLLEQDSGETSHDSTDSVLVYTYDELLSRVYNIMREKNPEMITGEAKKFMMKPPQVFRVGTKKSAFSNFAEICKIGSIDGNNCLIIKGRFQPKHIEIVLRKYIKEYVTCHTCRSPETILEKDNRLNYLQCETCGSRCSVISIKSGYQAVTGKRKHDRIRAANMAQAQTTKY